MVRKGNLLYNGDFEAKSVEGWLTGCYGKDFDYDFGYTAEEKYRGNYSGVLISSKANAKGYLAYDKICSFEEHDAFLFVGHIKSNYDFIANPVLYGLDDKDNLIRILYLGDIRAKGEWKGFAGIIRGISEITHFKVGLYVFCSNAGAFVYIDEFKLIPLKNITSHSLVEELTLLNVTSSEQYYLGIFALGKCKLRTSLKVENVSGTSPTLNTRLDVFYTISTSCYRRINHSEFTDLGEEEIVADLGDASIVRVNYIVGGTDPSFSISHRIALEPY